MDISLKKHISPHISKLYTPAREFWALLVAKIAICCWLFPIKNMNMRCLDDTSTPQYIHATIWSTQFASRYFVPYNNLLLLHSDTKWMYCLTIPKCGWYVACQRFNYCDNTSIRQFTLDFMLISTIPESSAVCPNQRSAMLLENVTALNIIAFI